MHSALPTYPTVFEALRKGDSAITGRREGASSGAGAGFPVRSRHRNHPIAAPSTRIATRQYNALRRKRAFGRSGEASVIECLLASRQAGGDHLAHEIRIEVDLAHDHPSHLLSE